MGISSNNVKGLPDTFPTITPSDSALITNLQYIRVGGAGNLVIKGIDGTVQTLAVTAGEYVPFGSGYVMAATTATGLVAFA